MPRLSRRGRCLEVVSNFVLNGDLGAGDLLLEKLDMLVEKRMIRRAQLAIKPLSQSALLHPKNLTRNDAHTIPCKNVAVNAIFAETSISRFYTSGIGIASITAPVTTFGIAIYCALAKIFIHFLPGIDLSHAKA